MMRGDTSLSQLSLAVAPHHPKRISYNGITLDFQSNDDGSIPSIRSNFFAKSLIFKDFFFHFFVHIFALLRNC